MSAKVVPLRQGRKQRNATSVNRVAFLLNPATGNSLPPLAARRLRGRASCAHSSRPVECRTSHI